ncbi:MAG: hypothetical protein M3O70_15045 [Actinomycetota bacterium]|nr:hypothetical protein [Actinomycetota bacterium]
MIRDVRRHCGRSGESAADMHVELARFGLRLRHVSQDLVQRVQVGVHPAGKRGHGLPAVAPRERDRDRRRVLAAHGRRLGESLGELRQLLSREREHRAHGCSDDRVCGHRWERCDFWLRDEVDGGHPDTDAGLDLAFALASHESAVPGTRVAHRTRSGEDPSDADDSRLRSRSPDEGDVPGLDLARVLGYSPLDPVEHLKRSVDVVEVGVALEDPGSGHVGHLPASLFRLVPWYVKSPQRLIAPLAA